MHRVKLASYKSYDRARMQQQPRGVKEKERKEKEEEKKKMLEKCQNKNYIFPCLFKGGGGELEEKSRPLF